MISALLSPFSTTTTTTIPPASNQPLPLELLPQTFCYLKQDALLACTRVCRAWSRSAQVMLYHDPDLWTLNQFIKFAERAFDVRNLNLSEIFFMPGNEAPGSERVQAVVSHRTLGTMVSQSSGGSDTDSDSSGSNIPIGRNSKFLAPGVDYERVRSSIVAVLSRSQNMESLIFNNLGPLVNDVVCASIPTRRLKRLELARTNVSCDGICSITCKPSQSSGLSSPTPERQVIALPKLVHVNVSHCVYLADRGLLELLKCPVLNNVTIHGFNPNFTVPVLRILNKHTMANFLSTDKDGRKILGGDENQVDMFYGIPMSSPSHERSVEEDFDEDFLDSQVEFYAGPGKMSRIA